MRVVFYGANAWPFRPGFAAAWSGPGEVVEIGDAAASASDRATLREAEVLVGTALRDRTIELPALRLFHVCGAGYDAVDPALLPPRAALCNCFGHEVPIAEYVLLAMLRSVHPVEQADRLLRRGEWPWCAFAGGEIRGELDGCTLGILGFGHIGREVARKAKAFDMRVVACNRSALATGPTLDAAYGLEQRDAFYAACDFILVALPLLPETQGFVDDAAFAAMRADAVLINVGRGPVVDERALYDALSQRRIGGAAIDTWYRYPGQESGPTAPATLPFHELDNILMTPHLSGWTTGTIRRRAQFIAGNVERLARGEPLRNVVRPAAPVG